MSQELKRCSCCDGGVATHQGGKSVHYLRCNNCEWRTHFYGAWDKAYAEWNNHHAPVPPAGGNSHVEARQCDACNHVGINDSAAGLAACHDCDWQGSDPVADECPACRNQNCMAAACPKCGSRYALIADATLVTPVPPAGGEVEVLAVVTLGSFSSEELGDIDVEPQMTSLERLQQQLVTSEDVSLELVDGAHVTRLRAENAALQQRLNVADQRVDDLESKLASLIPDGYCVMPRRLTAENGAKALLLGEFKVTFTRECPECAELEEPTEGCEVCDGEGEFAMHQLISWDKIKFIYSSAVAGLALKPKSEATAPK